MSVDYKGYKLLDRIMLVCRDHPTHDDSVKYGYQKSTKTTYQAYLVDPSNKNQLETARQWAKWTEYGPSYKNAEGKWVRDYEINHDPVEFDFENNGFSLELKDCAGGSSQGGKLSFWNCIVTKDDKTFLIGINSDMLLDLLQNSTFINGSCQSSLLFITQKGRVGMTVEGSETWKQCIKDRDLKKDMKSKMTSKYSFGDIVKTPTITEVYLGTITQYYTFDPGQNRNRYSGYYSGLNYRDCTITKLAKPVTYHLFDSIYYGEKKLSDFINSYGESIYSYPDLKKTCPKRTIDGKFDLDCTEEYFKQKLTDKIYDYTLYENYQKKQCYNNDSTNLYYFLGQTFFGFGFEPFKLSEELMSKIREVGIKYVEE
jgi:hypothetical protein